MSKAKLIADILEVSERTIFRWRKEKKLITELLYKYFSDEDLEQFITSQNIEKFESIDEFYEIKHNIIKNLERKFMFSIGSYGIKFIEMLKERNNIYLGRYNKDDLQIQHFYYDIKNNHNYKLFLDDLHEKKYNYFYRDIIKIYELYNDPIVKVFFTELQKRIIE